MCQRRGEDGGKEEKEEEVRVSAGERDEQYPKGATKVINVEFTQVILIPGAPPNVTVLFTGATPKGTKFVPICCKKRKEIRKIKKQAVG